MTPTEEALKEVLPYLPRQLTHVEIGKEFQPEVYEVLKIVGRLRLAREAVRISDLRRPTKAGDPRLVARYLSALRQTLWTALGTTMLSATIGVPAIIALIVFLKDGISFLHPYLAIFFILGSIALLAVAVMSAFAVKTRIESEIWTVLQTSYERP